MNNKQTRYIPSRGLAFAEEAEMKKLSRLAEQGWVLESFSFLGYKMRRSERRNLIYCLDIRDLQKSDKDEYFEMFRASGWELVCSQDTLHIFSAQPGTTPIYTDSSTNYDKYSRAIRLWKRLLAISVPLTIAFFSLYYVFNQLWEHAMFSAISYVAATLCLLVAAPAAMTYSAFLIRLKRLRQKTE
jgi:hypothetical protein